MQILQFAVLRGNMCIVAMQSSTHSLTQHASKAFRRSASAERLAQVVQ
nr:uncharacterized protein CTRU02_03650 [Colletotrichum truncatum]KAF6796672.1 hypothetical protein CTRU02_03650 [Colletotrichum truncatum]